MISLLLLLVEAFMLRDTQISCQTNTQNRKRPLDSLPPVMQTEGKCCVSVTLQPQGFFLLFFFLKLSVTVTLRLRVCETLNIDVVGLQPHEAPLTHRVGHRILLFYWELFKMASGRVIVTENYKQANKKTHRRLIFRKYLLISLVSSLSHYSSTRSRTN